MYFVYLFSMESSASRINIKFKIFDNVNLRHTSNCFCHEESIFELKKLSLLIFSFEYINFFPIVRAVHRLSVFTSSLIEPYASTVHLVATVSRVIRLASTNPDASTADLHHTQHSNTNV